jgi:AraC-like DNA-binding protein
MLTLIPPSPDLGWLLHPCLCLRGAAGGGHVFHAVSPDYAFRLVLRLSAGDFRLALLGPSTRIASVEVDQAADYLALRFRAGQGPGVAGVASGALLDRAVDVKELAGVPAQDLAARLLARPGPEERLRLVEGLLRQVPPLVRDARCRQAAALLEEHDGGLSLRELSAAAGLHLRSLERLFRSHLGLSPKRFARLARMHAVLAALRSGRPGALADLALRLGYADQPHMIRDFKELTGLIPTGVVPGGDGREPGPPRGPVVHRVRGQGGDPQAP